MSDVSPSSISTINVSISDVAAAELRRMAGLRLDLYERHPFWGHLLLNVALVPTTALPTFAATDCLRHIWFNPELTCHLSLRQLGFVLAHEIGHHVFESLARQDGRDNHLWNCATDYAINRQVLRIRGDNGQPLYELPDGDHPVLGSIASLHDPRFDALTAEAIYDVLRKEAQSSQRGGLEALLLPGGAGPQQVQDHGGGIDVHLPDRWTEAERDELLERLAAAVRERSAEGRRGDVPLEVERLVAAQGTSRVPWQAVLARFLGEAEAREQLSTARPSRKWLAHDVVVPGLVSEDAGRIVVAVDTSASIDEALLAAMAAELGALHALANDVTVLIADAKVHAEVQASDLPQFLKRQKWQGGGGTDHKPVFEWVRRRRLQPELFIGLTDLYSAFPDAPPGYPVLWLVPERHGTAPWGRVIAASLGG